MEFEESTSFSSLTPESSKPRKKGQATFLHKLFIVLEENQHPDLVSWSEDGTSVVIKDIPNFSQLVLSRLYGHQNVYSFIRQLNMYNFRKIKTSKFPLEYAHSDFVQGAKDLVGLIKRKTVHRKAKDNSTLSQCSEESCSVPDVSILQTQNDELKRAQQELQEQIKLAQERLERLSFENRDLQLRSNSLSQMSRMQMLQLESAAYNCQANNYNPEPVPNVQKMSNCPQNYNPSQFNTLCSDFETQYYYSHGDEKSQKVGNKTTSPHMDLEEMERYAQTIEEEVENGMQEVNGEMDEAFKELYHEFFGDESGQNLSVKVLGKNQSSSNSKGEPKQTRGTFFKSRFGINMQENRIQDTFSIGGGATVQKEEEIQHLQTLEQWKNWINSD